MKNATAAIWLDHLTTVSINAQVKFLVYQLQSPSALNATWIERGKSIGYQVVTFFYLWVGVVATHFVPYPLQEAEAGKHLIFTHQPGRPQLLTRLLPGDPYPSHHLAEYPPAQRLACSISH